MASSHFLATYNSKVIFCVFVLLWSACEGLIKLPKNVTVPAVFAFGDSIVDQGNNNDMPTVARANFMPYGKDFEGGVSTGRFGNGKTPPDMLAEELGITELIPAYLDPNLKLEDLKKGVSFASGGCGYDPETAKLVSAISLSDQVKLFKEYIGKLKAAVGEAETHYILTNSFYMVVAGSDDLINTYFPLGLQLVYNLNSYSDLMVSSASSFIQEIYKLGARRIAVFSLPPVGCVPSQRTLAGGGYRMCVEKYNRAAQLVNSKLSSECKSLAKKLPKSRVVYIDIYEPLLDLIQRPQNYGFEVADRGCCGTGLIEVIILCNKFSETCPDDTKYVFWDSYHPSEKAYKVLLNQVIQKYVNSFF
ncbi:unnamed protein product [Fraxinus pennsylvanica]|uniref:GDSL esterase/lipase EXL3 n=1 Tax=Fraxinus pennsylvanica TaxID=56036 RepID=A0AAD1YTX9_9LAMI|nr:unnamed protein product [Fraxinus pennsylvanica]